MPSRPPRVPDVRLDPRVQRRLDAQRREEEAAAARTRVLKLYVGLPLLGAALIASIVMSLSDDAMTSTIGRMIITSALWVVWKVRHRIKAALGF